MAGMEGGGRREGGRGGREGGCGRGRYHLGRGCGDQSEEIGHVLHVTVVNMIPLLPQPRMISHVLWAKRECTEKIQRSFWFRFVVAV